MWRTSFGFCNKVSLYGFSYRGDAIKYKYYWTDPEYAKKIASSYFLPFIRLKWPNGSRLLDPDTHCRRNNIARLAVAGCTGLPIRFGDGPYEYMELLERST